MKKFLIIISLLFVTVCYAAPPPDVGLDYANGTELVAPQDANDVVFNIEAAEAQRAQEVAFDYLGYRLSPAGEAIFEQTAAVKGPKEVPVLFPTNGIKESEQPPLLLIAGNSVLNKKMIRRLADRQHSNYGYPFTAN